MKVSGVGFILCLLLTLSCKDQKSKPIINQALSDIITESNHPLYITDMEIAHKKEKVYNNEMICFNLDITFGNNRNLVKIFTTPNSSSIRVDKKNGISTIMKDGNIYTNAKESEWDSEITGIFTYQYFFMVPYKLSDPGTKWEKLPPMEINGKWTNKSKLTFEKGTGESADDWYMIHSNPKSNLIEHIGYIVTGYGTSVEEAERYPHSISYADYKIVDGIPIATRWIFSEYDLESGLGNKIGEGILRNIDFMDLRDEFSVSMSDEYQLIN